MEEKIKKLINKVDKICVEFYFLKRNDLIDKGKVILEDIQEFGNYIVSLVEINKGQEEWLQINNFMMECINDYISAIRNKDTVLLIDTLDFGIRELASMFVEEDGNADE